MRRANGAIPAIPLGTAFAPDMPIKAPVSFGTSRATVDSVQGRLNLLFPIQ
jgi:hypothetical protein